MAWLLPITEKVALYFSDAANGFAGREKLSLNLLLFSKKQAFEKSFTCEKMHRSATKHSRLIPYINYGRCFSDSRIIV